MDRIRTEGKTEWVTRGNGGSAVEMGVVQVVIGDCRTYVGGGTAGSVPAPTQIPVIPVIPVDPVDPVDPEITAVFCEKKMAAMITPIPINAKIAVIINTSVLGSIYIPWNFQIRTYIREYMLWFRIYT